MAGSPASKPGSAASPLSKTSSSLPPTNAGSKPAPAAAASTASKQGGSPLSRPAGNPQQAAAAPTATSAAAARGPASAKPATTAAAAGGARVQFPPPLQVPTALAAPGLNTPLTSKAKTPGGRAAEDDPLVGEDKSYGTTAYWHDHSPAVEDLAQITSDWYGNWDELKLLLSRHMQCSDNVLLLGPGNCTLHEQLYDCGWRALTVVDNCPAALEAWKARSKLQVERHSLQFHVADPVAGFHYERFPYQAIIDKGVLDCILCRKDGVEAAHAAVAHMRAALASPGTLLVFSHGPPSRRLPLLRSVRWTNITVKQIMEPSITQQGPAASTLPPALLKDCPLSGPGGQFWAAEPAPGSAEASAAAGYVYICKHSLA